MKKGWEIKVIADLAKNLDSQRIPITKNKRESGSIPYYGASGIVDYVADYIFDEDLLLISEDGANLLARTYPIAFSVTGKTWVNNHAHVLRFNSPIKQKYIEYYLNSIKLDDYVSGMAQPKLNQKMLSSITIPIPPLPEQQQIVAILDKAFAAIDKAKANIERNLQNAKELFQSELNQIFSQKGEGWVEEKIEELTVIVTKGSSPKWQGINYVDKPGILFVTSENVGEGEMLMRKRKYVEERFNEKDKKSILKNGDVLTNIVGASIGRTAIYNLEEVANINQAVCLIRCKSNELYNQYLMYILNSPFFKEILHDNEVDNARANLSLTFFKNLVIPLPTVEKQKQVVKRIAELHRISNTLIENIEKKLANLDELKKSILQKAFAGELTDSEYKITDIEQLDMVAEVKNNYN